jgi:hypothetical protein
MNTGETALDPSVSIRDIRGEIPNFILIPKCSGMREHFDGI